MKKSLFVLRSVVVFVLWVAPAFAGTIDTTDQVTLQASPNNSFVFKGNGSSFTMSLKNVFGRANGQGTLIGANGSWYSILQNGATLTSAGSGCGGTCIMLNQSGNLIFKLGSSKGGSNLLTGFLTLVDISQSGSTGTTNNDLIVNLTITGGTLAPIFNGMGGIVQLTLALGNGNISGLKGILNAKIHGGTVNPLLPEPTSLALLGSGLVALSVAVRKRKKLKLLTQ